MGVLSTVVKAGGKLAFALKKAKPQIIFGVGVTVVVGSFVLAIVNARKINDEITRSEEKVNEIENDIHEAEESEDQNAIIALNKDLNKAKAETAWRMFVLIGVPSLTFVGGLCLTVFGHVLVIRRLGEVSATLAALQQTFDRYRQRNIEEHGAECDRRYLYGIVGEEKFTEKITDADGNEQEVNTILPVVDKNLAASMYTFEFSENTSFKCPKDPINTIAFLRSQEKYWNIWMETHGKPVTLYMILNDLGINLDPNDPRNDYILVAGWRPNGDGDCRIDFGVMRAVNKPAIDMLNNVIMLNFNCDGNIYHSTRYSKEGKKLC